MQWRGVRAFLGIETEESRKAWDDRIAVLVGAVIVVIILGAIVGMVAMMIQTWRGGTIPPDGNPLKAIFASRLMVAAARMAFLFAGVYIAISILVLMRRGQWLTAAGPFKVSDAIRGITERSQHRRERIAKLEAENARLRKELQDVAKLLNQAQSRLTKEGERA